MSVDEESFRSRVRTAYATGAGLPVAFTAADVTSSPRRWRPDTKAVVLVAAVVVLVAAGIAVAATGGHRGGAGPGRVVTTRPSTLPSVTTTTGPRTGSTSTTTTVVTTTTGPASRSADLPVVACSTEVAAGTSTPSTPLPTTRAVTVPVSLADALAVYADARDVMEVVAPVGWMCSALDATDGSSSITVGPGHGGPAAGVAPSHLPTGSAAESVTADQTSACVGCTVGQACPLFTSAATAYASQFGRPCPVTRPPGEQVATLASGIVAFTDPPGTAGDGNPSGGAYASDGVMTYHPGDADGSWTETCVLPAADRAECTAILNAFVTSYGSR
jgi:hypothetical protein